MSQSKSASVVRPAVLFEVAVILAAFTSAAFTPSGTAAAQTWTPIAHRPSFGASTALLLTDGTVMVQDIGASGCGGSNWWRLTPDKTGSYVNGTWSKLAALPTGYTPNYFASAVLPNGQVIINGGEYNGDANCTEVWTTKGALYDPPTNTWVPVKPPRGWLSIGDAQSAVLPNGTYMLADCCSTQQALLKLSTMTWVATGTGKADSNDEESWTLLPSGQLLTIDAENAVDPANTELFTRGAWASAGNTPEPLADPASAELGPAVLRPNGTVLAVGANGYTAVYTIAKKTWSAGPMFPKAASGYYDAGDGPAALLINGNVLVATSPGIYKNGVKFFEITAANTLLAAPATPNVAQDSSYYVRLLPLPNGQVLEDDGSQDVEIYTPAGAAIATLAPTIQSFPATVTHGSTYTLSGTHLNGWSQAGAYGDDYQNATNYPIVRITNTATGHVFYARTANHSSMAVASPKVVTTQVTIPSGIETGAATLVVVANGIPSRPLGISIE
jgi:hypothetical protein